MEAARANRHERRAAEVAAREDTMKAINFQWDTRLDGEELVVTVKHKLSGREWERRAKEEEWPAVRAELLAAIEDDLTAKVN